MFNSETYMNHEAENDIMSAKSIFSGFTENSSLKNTFT